MAGEDYSVVEPTVIGPKVYDMTKAERLVSWYVAQGYDIPLAFDGDRLVGFGVSIVAFNCLMTVRAVYLLDEYRGAGNMVAMYEYARAGRAIKKVFFQTVKAIPPGRLLGSTFGRREQIADDGKLITWEMRWVDEL